MTKSRHSAAKRYANLLIRGTYKPSERPKALNGTLWFGNRFWADYAENKGQYNHMADSEYLDAKLEAAVKRQNEPKRGRLHIAQPTLTNCTEDQLVSALHKATFRGRK